VNEHESPYEITIQALVEQVRSLTAERDAAVAERDRLRAEYDRCVESHQEVNTSVGELEDENDRLRAVLRGEDEAANVAAREAIWHDHGSVPSHWSYESESDNLTDARGVLRAAGRAVGVVEGE
jgi:chromosome segregation ATPase